MKFLKYGLLVIIMLIVLLIIYVRLAVHESRPEIIENENAELMADQMLKAVNKAAWDTLPYITWSFNGDHHYVWDRDNNHALVQWADFKVHLDPDEISGKAFKAGIALDGDEKIKSIQKAWSYWCNDMFWFAAPFKIKDPGTTLKVAKDKDDKQGLLVSYSSGGVTPGDSYLWYLDNDGLPTGYKMWVKIIPVGGVYTSWENWKTVEGGAQIASLHQGNISALKIDITNIKSGNSWQQIGYETNPIEL